MNWVCVTMSWREKKKKSKKNLQLYEIDQILNITFHRTYFVISLPLSYSFCSFCPPFTPFPSPPQSNAIHIVMLRCLRCKNITQNTSLPVHFYQAYRRVSGKPTTFFDRNVKSSLPQKIATYINDKITSLYDHIINEPVQDLIDRVPNLHNDLRRAADTENKLSAILSYDPTQIDPQLYYHFYEPPASASTERLLLKRLLFHQHYASCWALFMGNSLTDLDEFLRNVRRYLSVMENDFAILDFVIQMPELDGRDSYRKYIYNALYEVFDIDAEFVHQKSKEIANLSSIAAVYSFAKDDFISQTLCLKRIIQIIYGEENGNDASKYEIVNQLLKFPQIIRRPGWLTSVFPRFEMQLTLNGNDIPMEIEASTGAVEELLTKKQLCINLNNADVIYMLHSQVDTFTIFLAYRLGRSHERISNYLIQKLLDEETRLGDETYQNSTTNFHKFRAAFWHCAQDLERPLLVKCMDYLLPLETNFTGLFSHLNEEDQCDLALSYKNYTPAQRVSLIEHFHRNRLLARQLIKSLSVSDEVTLKDLKNLARANITTRKTLLEIHRSVLVRAHTIDGEILLSIVNKLLALIFKEPGNFQHLYYELDKKYKKLFHNSFREFAQAISILPPNKLAQTMDVLYESIQSDSFRFGNDEFAKTYIFKTISYDVYRFVARLENGVSTLCDTMEMLQGPKMWIKYWLVKSLVRSDYSNAFQLLNYYHETPTELTGYFDAIVTGIMKNRIQYSVDEKISILDDFFQKAKELGFAYRIGMRSCYEIFNAIKEGSRHGELDPETITWLNEFGEKNRHMRSLIQFMDNRKPRKKR